MSPAPSGDDHRGAGVTQRERMPIETRLSALFCRAGDGACARNDPSGHKGGFDSALTPRGTAWVP